MAQMADANEPASMLEQAAEVLGEEGNQPDPQTPPEPKEPDTKVPETQEELDEPAVPEPKEDDEDEGQEELEPPVSKRESKRIQKLLDKLAENDKQRQAPRQKERTQAIPEGDYNLEEVNDLAEQYADKRFQEGRAQANALAFQTRLEIDVPKVSQKYPYLDQESTDFDPGRADFLNRMFLKTVGYDPQNGTVQNDNVRYSEFVEGFMEMVEMSAASKTADATKNIAKQAAQTGARPSGTSKVKYQGSDPSKMSDDQLDAAIAQALGK